MASLSEHNDAQHQPQFLHNATVLSLTVFESGISQVYSRSHFDCLFNGRFYIAENSKWRHSPYDTEWTSNVLGPALFFLVRSWNWLWENQWSNTCLKSWPSVSWYIYAAYRPAWFVLPFQIWAWWSRISECHWQHSQAHGFCGAAGHWKLLPMDAIYPIHFSGK